MNFCYPAICHYEDGSYWCEFPDLESCFSQGDTEKEIVTNAEEALQGFIESSLERDIDLPLASPITSIKTQGKDFVTYISCSIENIGKSIRKNVTIPEWLNRKAEKASVNFSQVLQEALCKKLEISV